MKRSLLNGSLVTSISLALCIGLLGAGPPTTAPTAGDLPERWQRDWAEFGNRLRQAKEAGNVAATFAGRAVQWTGIVAPAGASNWIEVEFEPFTIDLGGGDKATVASITMQPSSADLKEWKEVGIGQRVTFRTRFRTPKPKDEPLIQFYKTDGSWKMLVSFEGGTLVARVPRPASRPDALDEPWQRDWTEFCKHVSAATHSYVLHEELRGRLVRWSGTINKLRPPKDKDTAWVGLDMAKTKIRWGNEEVPADFVGLSPTAAEWPAWAALTPGTRVVFETRFKDGNFQNPLLGPAVCVMQQQGKSDSFVCFSLTGGKLVEAQGREKGSNHNGTKSASDSKHILLSLQPIKARKSKRDVCIVKVEGGESIGAKHALLYVIFSPRVPDKLKELDPALLKLNFGSMQSGAFHGDQGSVAGFSSYTENIPTEVSLSLGEKQSATGSVGVKVQFWHFKDGKWEPCSKVMERTLELDDRAEGPE